MSYQDIAYTPGSGGLAKVDRIAGSDIPRVKPVLGGEGEAVVPSTGAGNVDTGTLRQTLAANDPAVVALAAILAKIIAAPATEAKQDTLIAKDFATNTTLAAIGSLLASGIAVASLPAGLATSANQSTSQSTLASILDKIIAAPATEAKQDTLIAKDFATQTTLAALLAKVIAAPATEAKQDTLNTLITTIDSVLDAIAASVAGATPAGTNLIGAVAARMGTSTMYDGTTAVTPKFAAIAASSSGNNTILAAVTSKKIRVLSLELMAAGAVNAKFQSGAGGTDLTGLKYLDAAGAGIVLPFNPIGWFETASGALLNLNLSGAVAVGGSFTYLEI